MHDTMVFSIFTDMCNHDHLKFQNIFITPKETHTYKQLFPILLSPLPLAIISLLFVFMEIHFLDISYKWNYTQCDLLSPAYFTWHVL